MTHQNETLGSPVIYEYNRSSFGQYGPAIKGQQQ